MSRLPIRIRIALAFAAAMTLVLAGAGIYVYLRLDADLTETIDDGLERNVNQLITSLSPGYGSLLESGAAPAEADEGFAQVIGPDGRLIEEFGGSGAPVLTAAELERAMREPYTFEGAVEGVEENARIIAGPIDEPGVPEARAYAIGRSTEDREEILADVVASFAIGGPVAVVIASLLGLALAGSALRPMEAMRRRAAGVSLEPGEPLLPLPQANDEVRRLGETLNEMLERLRTAFERERRFVADAAHELRTPIAVVRAELDAAVRAPDAGPLARESLGQALAECDRLAALADDLLVLARAADGALPVRLEALDAAAELEGTRVRFAERAASAGRALRVDAPAGLELDADPLRLRQALGNLVDNALRHGQGEVILRARRDDGAVELEVADEGGGFGDAVAESAFERFTRGDEARSGGGAGLGLAIVKTIAEAHGGSAEIADPGDGSVRIRFPERSQGDLRDRS